MTWQVVSADGHAVREAFVFHVGAPGDRPEGIARELPAGEGGAGRWEGLPAGVARWALFAALLVLGGVLAFPLLVGDDAEPTRRRLFAAAWAVAVVATVVGLVVQGAVAGRQSVRRSTAAAVVVTVAVLATPGLAGHAGTTSPVALNVAADVVHVTAAAAWIGGLVVLLAWPRLVPEVVTRFSAIATVAVGAIVATGLVRSWAEVRSLDALDKRYGLVLLAKVAVFAAMVAFGFLNRRVLVPRLAAAGRSLRRSMWRRRGWPSWCRL